jgi:type II secretory pathway pseudopilin PulG
MRTGYELTSGNFAKHIAALVLLLASIGRAQTAPAPRMRPRPQAATPPTVTTVPNPFAEDLKKYPGLLEEISRLTEKLQNQIQFPPDRNQSRILPLLPSSNDYFAAFANYGDATHQALAIFQQELQQSAVLRDWWQHGDMALAGPKLESGVEQFYEFSQYLGDEIVVSGDTLNKNSQAVAVVEVRKPGLKQFLKNLLGQLGPNPNIRVIDPQELADTTDPPRNGQLIILVRSDFVIAAPSFEAVRSFNHLLDSKPGGLDSTPFGHKLTHEYQAGVGVLIAADVQKILQQAPIPPQAQASFQQTGFGDAEYLIWQHKMVSGQAMGDMELSFTGPRRGIAGWLAAPTPLKSLSFVSPKAIGAGTIVLKNLGEIFDDIKQLSNASNPNSFAMADQMQMMMGVDLKADLLSHLTGEITGEIDGVVDRRPEWRAILGVTDPERVEQTLEKLMAGTGQRQTPSVENGITYHSLVIPSPQNPVQITYTFADGYLIIGSSHDSVANAIRIHHSGESLANSEKILASNPRGRSQDASAFFYEDPLAMMAENPQLTPEMLKMISNFKTSPVVVRAYGEPNAIHAISNGGLAAGAPILMGAAIAIPNLLRARGAANDAAAVSTMRSIIMAQTEYSTAYPRRGYARNLAMLGASPAGGNSAEHAGLMDWSRDGGSCSPALCTKSGFRFILKTTCDQNACDDFTVFAVPLSANGATKTYCATSDGVLRSTQSATAAAPLNAAECRKWPRLP